MIEAKKDIKILIIRTGAIGDVVHTTNTYRAVKKAYPSAQIHYLTTKVQSSLLENDFDLSSVIIIDKKSLKPFSKDMFETAKKLQSYRFDLVINLQPSLKTRLLVFLSGIKKQLIYKKSFKKHAVNNFFDTANEYFKNLTLDNKLKIYLNDEVTDIVHQEFEAYTRPIVVINAGGIDSPRQGRTYPVRLWSDLIIELQKLGAQVVLTGVEDDRKYLYELENIHGVVSLISKTTIEKTAAVIKEADLLISGDSGPLHIASAVGTNALGLYGSMPVSRTGVYGVNCVSIASALDCVPCNRRKCKFLKKTKKIFAPCMEKISVEDILQESQKLLKK